MEHLIDNNKLLLALQKHFNVSDSSEFDKLLKLLQLGVANKSIESNLVKNTFVADKFYYHLVETMLEESKTTATTIMRLLLDLYLIEDNRKMKEIMDMFQFQLLRCFDVSDTTRIKLMNICHCLPLLGPYGFQLSSAIKVIIDKGDEPVFLKFIWHTIPEFVRNVPKAVELEVMKHVWDSVELMASQMTMRSNCKRAKIEVTKTTNVLCALCDFLLQHEVNVQKHHLFWTLISKGLICWSAQTRKQAVYVLKRCIALANLDSAFLAECSTVFACGLQTWPKFSEKWMTYMIIMEGLEEKQVHVVKPVLARIPQLLYPDADG